MPAYNYYHHERMRVCLHAYANLESGSMCSTDLPRCGTILWNQRNACHCKGEGTNACQWFHGSAKITSYYIKVDHRHRIYNSNKYHFFMEPWNHNLYPLFLSLYLCSITRGTMWNHVEPPSSGGARQARASI